MHIKAHKKKQKSSQRWRKYLQPQEKDGSATSRVHAPSVTVTAGRLGAPGATRGGEGRDNGFHNHSLYQLSLNGNYTRCVFLHHPISHRTRVFSFGTHL
ncbi:hypothetical protein DY000_02023792 [Brassica cretica]|uniref:Uncharacterized protein n=1 Tax=Brassica cretica TaxID=69181 RepID=A0ABQ7EK04_BRACR|nr:hypothetical protein DY000_02023792 [Brassica cretica]